MIPYNTRRTLAHCELDNTEFQRSQFPDIHLASQPKLLLEGHQQLPIETGHIRQPPGRQLHSALHRILSAPLTIFEHAALLNMAVKLQSPSGFLLLAALSCALYVAECTFDSPVVDKDFTCPTGFIPMTDIPPYTTARCRANPCYGNPGPCGASELLSHPCSLCTRLFLL
jgi:hypothetical protein